MGKPPFQSTVTWPQCQEAFEFPLGILVSREHLKLQRRKFRLKNGNIYNYWNIDHHDVYTFWAGLLFIPNELRRTNETVQLMVYISCRTF